MRGSEGLHCVLASTDVRDVQQRAAQPLAEQALAGRGGAVVQGAHQAACPTPLTALQYLYHCTQALRDVELPGGSVRQAWARKQEVERRQGAGEGDS